MLRLIVQEGPLAGSEFSLPRGLQAALLIGCSAECAVRVADNGAPPHVAPRHAVIESDGARFFLLDQRSPAGTFVNGARIEQIRLRDGDVITLGPAGPHLLISIDEHATGSLSPAAATGPARLAATDDLANAETTDLAVETTDLKVETEPMYAPPTVQWSLAERARMIGLYDPAHDDGHRLHSTRLGWIGSVCAFFGAVLVGLLVFDLGLNRAAIGAALAFGSVLIYLAIFLWLDRFEPEPYKTLALAFFLGATICVPVSAVMNDLTSQRLGELLTSVVFAPFVEEASKGAGVLLIVLLFRRDFDSIVDGIIYAGVVALGFATVENIEYYGQSLARHGVSGLAGTFLLRGLMSPFSHVLFTCATGIGFGVARETHNRAWKIAAPLMGFSCAVALHSFWNALAGSDPDTFIKGYLLLEVPLFIFFMCSIGVLVHREGMILRQTLQHEVARRLIDQHHLDIAISIFRRSLWTMAALGDRRRFNARREFLRAVVKLGLCHWHGARASEAQRNTGSLSRIARLQAEVYRLKDQI